MKTIIRYRESFALVAFLCCITIVTTDPKMLAGFSLGFLLMHFSK